MSNLPLLALYILGFIAIFYFLAIRPQQRQRRAHEEMVASVRKGDEIMTVGGLIGKVTRVDDDRLLVQVARGVEVKMTKRAIAEIVKEVPRPDALESAEDEE